MADHCANCLTHRTNIAKLEDRYDMEKQEWMIGVMADIKLLMLLCAHEGHPVREQQ